MKRTTSSAVEINSKNWMLTVAPGTTAAPIINSGMAGENPQDTTRVSVSGWYSSGRMWLSFSVPDIHRRRCLIIAFSDGGAWFRNRASTRRYSKSTRSAARQIRFVSSVIVATSHVVISGHGHGILWSPECVKRNDIAAGLRPRPTEVGRAVVPILLFLRIRGPSPSRTRRCIS